MTVGISIKMTDEGKRVLAENAKRRANAVQVLSRALAQGLAETANHLKINYVRGGNWKTKRDGQGPLAVRSGALLASIDSVMDAPLEGRVGTLRGTTTKYAKALLGDETLTIVPKTAKKLWIPIADNLGPSGMPRMSPREAMEQVDADGDRRLQFFTSKKGNLVAFLPDEKGGKYSRGKNKGLHRGKLLFVLKDSVELKGTGALGKAVEDKIPRIQQLLQDALDGLIGGTK